MLVVEVKHNDVDFALRLLKKKVQKSGMIRELRRCRYDEKPSERRRRQKREGIKTRGNATSRLGLNELAGFLSFCRVQMASLPIHRRPEASF